MFEEWGFLLTEIWGLLALSALIGLIAGWLFWGGRSTAMIDTSEADRLRDDLRKCRAAGAEKDAKIAKLTASLDEEPPIPTPTPVVAPAAVAPVSDDFDGDGIVEGTDEGIKPATLDAPRDGMADDLKKIKGVGLKMEKLCNKLGFWHFDQIAAWSVQEVAWVDANLEGFKGRVTRDDWVAQAALLASGGTTEFSSRVGKGDVY
jgi:predicted flap endonuclease-1-like 5' DNA nuclease